LAGWLVLAVLLVLLVPLFVCMPLTPDVSFYQIAAQHILRGGALERDLLFLPPPGLAWAFAAVGSTLGWTSWAMRVADLGVFGGIVVLLVVWLKAAGVSRAVRAWAAVLLCAFYLTTSEWSHGQPDTWMLLPALAALHLRRRRTAALLGAAGGLAARWSIVEGLLWGAACLIKPFVVVPGLLVWLVSAGLARRSGAGWSPRLAADAAGPLAGGLLAAAAWQLWLIQSGSFGAYWHNYAVYHSDYTAQHAAISLRAAYLVVKMFPWGLLNLMGLPIALVSLFQALLARGRPAATGERLALPLLSGLYVGWVLQSTLFQFQFDYHLVPSYLLASALAVSWLATRAWRLWGLTALVLLSIAVLALGPACAPGRLFLWPRCWREGPTPDLQNQLALRRDAGEPDWRALADAQRFLHDRHVRDRDLMCYDLSTTSLHVALGVRPATRFIYPSMMIFYLPSHRAAIRRELQAGPQRYVVTDLQTATELSPELKEIYPYNLPIIFRAGRYLVHEATPPDKPPP